MKQSGGQNLSEYSLVIGLVCLVSVAALLSLGENIGESMQDSLQVGQPTGAGNINMSNQNLSPPPFSGNTTTPPETGGGLANCEERDPNGYYISKDECKKDGKIKGQP